ncbi:MAG: peptidoglycan/LPS O-acetylase OafA/YrhL [Bacteroidia bacterium]|jgi:peptidoglycan/LPS O-acetylase OafA/YrhL
MSVEEKSISKKKRIYFENLDGLRFLCFLSVFFFHSFHTEYEAISGSAIYHFFKVDIFGNGNIGVNFFFVLSGFLITFLLIEEKKLNGQINLKKFWIRRMLRIWPLFYFCVLFGFYIFPILKTMFGQVPNETANIGYYLLFLNNFDFINNGIPDSSMLGLLWSVAIEEQFYLVWPIILFLLPIKRYWMAFVAIIGVSLVFRAFNDVGILHEHHTLSCIGDMAIGAFGAWLVNQFDSIREYFENLNKGWILSFYALFWLIFFFRDEFMYDFYVIRIFERSFLAIVILLIILEQNYSKKSFFKMSRLVTISKLGVISYGLYCLHKLGILITINLTKIVGLNYEIWHVMVLETALALLITIVISKVSYRFYESPFLKLKDKYAFITKN